MGEKAAEPRALWTAMARIRAFETRLAGEYETGDIPGHIHLYLGQEAIAAGVCAHLIEADSIASTHRGHGHALAKGCDPAAMMAEIFGRESGLCRGRGGSMHLADLGRGLLGCTGIVGANAPLALGAALTAKTLKTGNVAVCFLGDGGANQGAAFEAMNMAAALALPCLFVIEDNGFGEFTPAARVTGTEDLAGRAASFGMPASTVDGTDALAVAAAAGEAVARARAGGRPATLVAQAPRFSGHFEGDSQAYRGEDPEARIAGKQDPLVRFRARMAETGALGEVELDAIERAAEEEMAGAVAAARAAPWPEAASLGEAVYTAAPGGPR